MKLSQFIFIVLFGSLTFILPIFLMKTVSLVCGIVVGVVLFVSWCLIYDKIESGIHYEDEEGFYEV